MIRSIPCLVFATTLLLPALTGWAQHEHGEGSHAHHRADHQPGHDSEYRHETMDHDFSGAEEWSARFDSPERKAWQKPAEVVELLGVEPGMTVVDLGAGTGYFLGYLSAAAGDSGRVLALDPESDMIRFMAERAQRENLANVEPRRIPFDDPQLEPASVDRVLIVNTWHHIEERPDYAGKLRAALKPGGAVYIVDFTRDSPSGPPVEERLRHEQVIVELEGGGLEATAVEETLPRQYVVVGRRPD